MGLLGRRLGAYFADHGESETDDKRPRCLRRNELPFQHRPFEHRPSQHRLPLAPERRRPPPPSFEESQRVACRSYFACVTLHGHDRTRLSNFAQADVEAVEAAAQTLYRVAGESRAYARCREIQIAGASPWTLSYYGEVRARGLLLNIASSLSVSVRGWVLQAAFDVTARQGMSRGECHGPVRPQHCQQLLADSLYFRKDELAPPPPLYNWIAVSFDQYDALKIVGPMPEGLVEELVRDFAVQSSVGMHRSQEGSENDVLICQRELTDS
ncbi:hypothetical protein GGTG_08880 [Gaeumannomyces tritici R3-111a-1]|uniref:Uncharacterized protein n=1 Tax=Gaeumannomyces tritici (strain R3-111a-1) TaxID=644352 RepID=J3P5U0_GAET3|nr:hypothetical protein GGTG_08880 [Gaeumannomyces tritici R3-111a-1]EJT75042.1 hypothetical protein GGTG_08880 [Gaeumannomyces tritici R3-111a-1]